MHDCTSYLKIHYSMFACFGSVWLVNSLIHHSVFLFWMPMFARKFRRVKFYEMIEIKKNLCSDIGIFNKFYSKLVCMSTKMIFFNFFLMLKSNLLVILIF